MRAALAWPYRTLTAAAEWAAHLPLPGQGKLARSLRARRDALGPFRAFAATRRDAALTHSVSNPSSR